MLIDKNMVLKAINSIKIAIPKCSESEQTCVIKAANIIINRVIEKINDLPEINIYDCMQNKKGE